MSTTRGNVSKLEETRRNEGSTARDLDRNAFSSRSHPHFPNNLSQDRTESVGSLSNPRRPTTRRYSYYSAMRRGTRPSSLANLPSVVLRNRGDEEQDKSFDSENESPDLSRINRASTGSQYARFQIDFSAGNPANNNDEESTSSSSSDEAVSEKLNEIQGEVNEIKPSHSSSSSEGEPEGDGQCIPTLSGSSNRTLQSHSETNLGFTTVVDVSLVQEERTESRQSFEEGQEMKEKSLVRRAGIKHRKYCDDQSLFQLRKSRSRSCLVNPPILHDLESVPPPLPQGPRPVLSPPATSTSAQPMPLSTDLSTPPVTKEKGEFLFKRYKLHNPRNAEKLKHYLKKRKYDQVERDENGDTPLHAIVRSDRKDKFDLLMVLMVYSDYGNEEVDLPAINGNTALHIAMLKNDVISAEVLLSFGADINALNEFSHTPLDILSFNGQGDSNRSMWELLLSLDAENGHGVKKPKKPLPRLTSSFLASLPKLRERLRFSFNDDSKQRPQDEQLSMKLANELETNMNEIFRTYESIQDADMQMALGLQQFELKGWKTTGGSPIRFKIEGGSRILFLDGGGIRGLIQIEVLSMLEKRTGKRITELFDWIVGTSTGGIVALGLVYGKKTLAEVRQFYFKMKDEVFNKSRFGFGGNHNTTLALEEVLKETLSYEHKMSDVKEPKVLVTAVDKKTTKPTLVFFNNCFEDEYSNEYIWKVARYTSAAPMYFSELDGYIDGGILANNPSDYGLTAIQNFYQRKGSRLEVSCVVSIGNGIFPAKQLGNTDVHEMLLGMKILNIQAIQKRAKNLMTLLSNALVEADDVVKNCKSRCEAQDIPFHRFSPMFSVIVDSDETDDLKLVNMLIQTRIQALIEWSEQLDELEEIFKLVSEQARLKTLKKFRKKHQQMKEKMRMEALSEQSLTQ